MTESGWSRSVCWLISLFLNSVQKWIENIAHSACDYARGPICGAVAVATNLPQAMSDIRARRRRLLYICQYAAGAGGVYVRGGLGRQNSYECSGFVRSIKIIDLVFYSP